jgi:hypothetical protein
MNDVIELSQARIMAREGLPGGNFPAWNLGHFETYGRRFDEILGKGNRALRHGAWLYDPETLVLRHVKTDYEVDLEKVTTAEKLLDWVLQLVRRPHMKVTEMLELMQAVADARGIGSLQGAFCPYGQTRPPIKW